MCLFFGSDFEDCDHAECQIVKTIKLLTTTSIFTPIHHHPLKRGPPSIQKNQSKSSKRLHYEQIQNMDLKQQMAQDYIHLNRNDLVESCERKEAYHERISYLEREVSDLKGLVGWMKLELEKKGIFN